MNRPIKVACALGRLQHIAMKAHAILQALGQSNYTVLSLDDLNKIKRYSTVSRVQVGTNTSKGTYLLMIDITQRI